jgi:hypothetical protein
VVVDAADTGTAPAGFRLRRLAVRLVLAAGLAGIALILGAALNAGTASADELPATANDNSSGGLLGTLVGSVTDTVTGVVSTSVSATLSTTLDVVDTTVHSIGTVVGGTPNPAPADTAPDNTTTPAATPVTTRRSSVPVTTKPVAHTAHHEQAVVSTRTVRRHPVGTRHAATVAAPRAVRAAHPATPAAHIAGPGRHRPVPLPAPQEPNPAMPVSSCGAGHSPTGPIRSAFAVVPSHSDRTALAAADGWSADPAVLAARSQGLPTTSPD